MSAQYKPDSSNAAPFWAARRQNLPSLVPLLLKPENKLLICCLVEQKILA
jgi:hypothetical protein